MTFNILKHLDKLTPVGEKDRYFCPVCQGNNLTVDPKTGKYQCWNGCECKDIRNEIAPLTQTKVIRPKSDRTWTYTDRDGNLSIRTRRRDDGQGKRKIWQQYLIDGQWALGSKVADDLKAHLKSAIAPYKYVECKEAIARGETIYWVEGEPCADALWVLGLATTTSIGGSASYSQYGDYSDCFAKAQLVIVPDRDKTGIKYAEAIASDYPTAQWLYAYPDSPLWNRLPEDGGLDISDWIDELRDLGLSDEQIRDRIVKTVERGKRSPQQPSVAESQKPVEPDEQEDETADLKALLALTQGQCPPLLHESIVTPLENISARLNLPVEAYITVLLSVLGSRLQIGTQLELDESTDYFAKPILWVGLAGETGTRKSPILRTLTAPLLALQEESEDGYQSALETYEHDLDIWEGDRKSKKDPSSPNLSKPKPPAAREHYLSDFTLEALGDVIRTQREHGILVNIDELARFFSSMDMYRSGKGGDRQHWLSFYDGGEFKSNRKTTGRIFARQTAINAVGGVQPSIIQKLMTEDKSTGDGLWPRFSWVKIPLVEAPPIGGGTTYDVSDRLKALYLSLSQIPPITYKLSSEAKTLWNQWHCLMEKGAINEYSELMRGLYPKFKERAARIALIAHVANSKQGGTDPREPISAQTLFDAIAFAKWLFDQTRLLYAEIGQSTDPELARVFNCIRRFEGQTVSAKQIRAWWHTKQKPVMQVCRDFMAKIVKIGYAEPNELDATNPKYEITICLNRRQFVNKPENQYPESDTEVTILRQNVVNVVTNSLEQTMPSLKSEKVDDIDEKMTTLRHPEKPYRESDTEENDEIDEEYRKRKKL